MPRSKATLPGGARIADYVSLGVLATRLPKEIILEAVRAAGKESQRRRDLPAELVVQFALALWLYRDVSYEDVLDCLLESWRWLGLKGSKGATKGAISQARDRLGAEPLRMLFERVCLPLATKETPGAWYKGKRLVAVDGTLFDTPDTNANAQAFGYPENQLGKGAFPKVRALVLSETSTHATIGCAIGSYTTSERTLLRELLPKIQPDMLLLADRGFFGVDLWNACCQTGATLLWRVKTSQNFDMGEALPDGSYIAYLPGKDEKTSVRIIAYSVAGSNDVAWLMTNEMDHQLMPAMDLAKLYPQRWESELCFDEMKCHLGEAKLSLRSKKPELVKQEIWALLVLHWTIRELMFEAAQVHARDPDEISFSRAVRLVKLHQTKDGNFSP